MLLGVAQNWHLFATGALALVSALGVSVLHQNPEWYKRLVCARKLISISRSDAQRVNCAKVITNCNSCKRNRTLSDRLCGRPCSAEKCSVAQGL